MLAPNLDKFANMVGLEHLDFDHEPQFEEFRNSEVPFVMDIQCNGYVGDFDRELIGYVFGILEASQMENNFCPDERRTFWNEVFGKAKAIEYGDEYVLLDEYLYETFQSVDDWEEVTFYNISVKDSSESTIHVQFAKMLPASWSRLIISRIRKFFDLYGDKYKSSLRKVTLKSAEGKTFVISD